MANVEYILTLKDRVTATANKISNSLAGVNQSAVSAANSIDTIGLVAAGAAVAGIFTLGAELEKTTLFFNTLTGSVERGTKLFEELTQFANSTPFSNEAINKNAQVLLAFGQKADGVTDTLRMLGDVAGGDQEKFRLVTLAFSQIQSAGRLMGQDLLQLINAGFNPLQEISAKTGKSMAVLKKQMEKGAISADLVTKAFQSATGPGGRFHQLTIKMSTTMSGLWSTAMGKATFLLSEFGLSMKGIFTPLLRGLISGVEYLDKFKSSIFPILKGIVVFTSVIVTLSLALKAYAVIQGIVNVLMAANPFVLAVIAISALVAIIVVAYQESEKFREVVERTWNATKALGSAMKTILTPAFEALKKVLLAIWNPIKRILLELNELLTAATSTGDTIRTVLTNSIRDAIMYFEIFTKVLGDVLYFFTQIVRFVGKFLSFDFSGSSQVLQDWGDTIYRAIVQRIELALKAFKYFVQAFDALKSGDFGKTIDKISEGFEGLTAGILGVDADKAKQQAKQAAAETIKAYNAAIASGKTSLTAPSLGLSGGSASQSLGLSAEAKKLQAEGIVSGGGIKTFNINIASLTGINTLTTENITEGANQVSKAIQDALLRGLADVKLQ